MTEKLAYHPWKVTRTSASAEGTAAGHPGSSRAFADILATAEAVQDSVTVRKRNGSPASSGIWNHLAGGAMHTAAALLMKPLPMMGWESRDDRLRRGGAQGESTPEGEA
jgi:hypothetical protein